MARDHAWIERLAPRVRYGVILPGTGGVQRGVDYQFYRLAPPDVMQIGVGLGIGDYSAAGIQAALPVLRSCIQTLVAEHADCIMLSGVPVSAGLGRRRVLELIDDVPRTSGVPFEATLEAILRSLAHLDARHVVMASRFPAGVNQAIASYLAEAGVEVLATTSRDLSLSQARGLSMQAGMQLALDLGREAAAAQPDAEAILVPGGATLSLHAIPALEAEFGKPVLTNLSAEIWSALIRTGLAPSLEGWGTLLASPPPTSRHGAD